VTSTTEEIPDKAIWGLWKGSDWEYPSRDDDAAASPLADQGVPFRGQEKVRRAVLLAPYFSSPYSSGICTRPRYHLGGPATWHPRCCAFCSERDSPEF